MTYIKDKKFYASFLMMLLIASPFTPNLVMADDSFCVKSFSQIYLNDYIAGALQSNGSFVSWGVNQFGGLGYGYAGQIQSTPVQVYAPFANWIQIAMNLYYTIALGLDHNVYGWGTNAWGNLGNIVPLGSVKLVASQPPNIIMNGVKFVATHGLQWTTYAIKDGGQLFGFGDNSHAQLGVATGVVPYSVAPLQIGAANNWVAVYPSKRDSHVCATNAAGNLYCWGENYQYQVGDGTMTDRATPLLIGTPANSWLSVHPQLSFTIALKSDGTLWGWGTTFYGIFGTGSNWAQFTTPTQIAGGMTFKAIAVHDNYMLAIGTNGKLYGWGENMYTQVNSNAGVGIQNTPNLIDNAVNWKEVYVSVGIQMNAVGSAFAIKNNDNLFAWGSNGAGQLGLNSNAVSISVPTLVMGSVDKVVSVGYTTGIIRLNGDIYTTGFNNFNLLGDGTINTSIKFHSCMDPTKNCVANACV